MSELPLRSFEDQGPAFPHYDEIDTSLTFKAVWEKYGLTQQDIDPLLTGIGMKTDSPNRITFRDFFYNKPIEAFPEITGEILKAFFVALHHVGVLNAKQNPHLLKAHYMTHTSGQFFRTHTTRRSRPDFSQPQQPSFDPSKSLEQLLEGRMHVNEFIEKMKERGASDSVILMVRSFFSKPFSDFNRDAPTTFEMVLRVLRHEDFILLEPSQVLAKMRVDVGRVVRESVRPSVDTQELGPEARDALRRMHRKPPGGV